MHEFLTKEEQNLINKIRGIRLHAGRDNNDVRLEDVKEINAERLWTREYGSLTETSSFNDYPLISESSILECLLENAVEEIPLHPKIGTIYQTRYREETGAEVWEICQPKKIPEFIQSVEIDILGNIPQGTKPPIPQLRELHDEEVSNWRKLRDNTKELPDVVHSRTRRTSFKVLDNGMWRCASNTEMENWGKIPEENKRMDFLIGVISNQ